MILTCPLHIKVDSEIYIIERRGQAYSAPPLYNIPNAQLLFLPFKILKKWLMDQSICRTNLSIGHNWMYDVGARNLREHNDNWWTFFLLKKIGQRKFWFNLDIAFKVEQRTSFPIEILQKSTIIITIYFSNTSHTMPIHHLIPYKLIDFLFFFLASLTKIWLYNL